MQKLAKQLSESEGDGEFLRPVVRGLAEVTSGRYFTQDEGYVHVNWRKSGKGSYISRKKIICLHPNFPTAVVDFSRTESPLDQKVTVASGKMIFLLMPFPREYLECSDDQSPENLM